MTHDNVHLRAWRQAVGWALRAALPGEPTAGDVTVKLHFMVQPRRQGDAPDLDKLCRAVLDALTGIIWIDDKQVVVIEARRTLLGPDALPTAEGAHITLETTPCPAP